MLSQRYPRKEIIVMDNASTDRTADIARAHRVTVVANKENIGYARSVNKGLRLARGKYVILLHADHRARDRNWIAHMLKPFSDPRVGAVISQRVNKHRARMNFAERLFDSLSPLGMNTTGRLKEVSSFREKCDAYRKDVIRKLGYFDEIAYPHGGEDNDMSIKMRAAGYTIVLSDAAVVEHVFSSSQNSLLSVFRKCDQMGRAGTTLYRRYKVDALRRRMLLTSMLAFLLAPFSWSTHGAVGYSLLFIAGLFSPITLHGARIPLSLVSAVLAAAAYVRTRSLFSISVGVALTHAMVLAYYGVSSVKNSLRAGDSILQAPATFFLSIVCRMLFATGYLRERVRQALRQSAATGQER